MEKPIGMPRMALRTPLRPVKLRTSPPLPCPPCSFYLRVFNWPSQFCRPLCPCAYISPQSAHTCESIYSQFISATSNPSQPHRRGLQFRDPVVQERDGLPQGWSSLGCYTWVPTTVLLIGPTV